MSKAGQILLLTLAVFLAYLWLSIPVLAPYSLQAFAGCILAYFILKKFNDAKFWILPNTTADEMTLALFAILLLVGATGLTSSWFFPLIYLYLFFLSLSLDTFVAISVSLQLILFFYAQIGHNLPSSLSQAEITHLISLPLILIFFLFAKHQYQEAQKHKTLVKIESEQLDIISQDLLTENQWQDYILNFLNNFLYPELENLRQQNAMTTDKQGLARDQTTNQQLDKIQTELEKLINNINNHRG